MTDTHQLGEGGEEMGGKGERRWGWGEGGEKKKGRGGEDRKKGSSFFLNFKQATPFQTLCNEIEHVLPLLIKLVVGLVWPINSLIPSSVLYSLVSR